MIGIGRAQRQGHRARRGPERIVIRDLILREDGRIQRDLVNRAHEALADGGRTVTAPRCNQLRVAREGGSLERAVAIEPEKLAVERSDQVRPVAHSGRIY